MDGADFLHHKRGKYWDNNAGLFDDLQLFKTGAYSRKQNLFSILWTNEEVSLPNDSLEVPYKFALVKFAYSIFIRVFLDTHVDIDEFEIFDSTFE